MAQCHIGKAGAGHFFQIHGDMGFVSAVGEKNMKPPVCGSLKRIIQWFADLSGMIGKTMNYGIQLRKGDFLQLVSRQEGDMIRPGEPFQGGAGTDTVVISGDHDHRDLRNIGKKRAGLFQFRGGGLAVELIAG